MWDLYNVDSKSLARYQGITMRSTVLGFALFCAAIVSGQPSSTQCKTFPGDKVWPSKIEWDQLNSTVSGRLVATVPLGTPCHGASFNNATCESLKEQWQFEKVQYVLNVLCRASH
jgi:hypothetical protein